MSMICACGEKTKVSDTRQRDDGTVRRRHTCVCGEQFTTVETREIESSNAGRGRFLKVKTGVTCLELLKVAKLLKDASDVVDKVILQDAT